MFREARIKLTIQYLGIIMLISFFFSLVIYLGINRELGRIDHMQQARQQRTEDFLNVYEEFRRNRAQMGMPAPSFVVPLEETISIPETRARILTILGIINLSILGISGVAGYFLAGETLHPIQVMLEEQKDFISNASHELRTPLSSLKSEIEVALRNKKITVKEAKDLLKSNLEEVDKMAGLSDYLLRLDRYQRGKSNFRFSRVNLKKVAEESIKKVQSLAKERKIKIVNKLKNAIVQGNQESLVELATILLDNAIKYSPPGKRVILSTLKEGPSGVLRIQDFGMGIDKKDLPHLFERFYRAEASRSKNKVDGYGLGLSIAKSIVELHGGKVQVESSPQKGSTFTAKI
jgi:signal transduction histidine kinase